MAFFFNNESQPVIAVLDDDGNQLFHTAVNMTCRVKREKVYPDHTLENSSLIFDDVYEIPAEVKLDFILDPNDYRDVYSEILEAWKNNTSFTIQTRVEVIKDMYLPIMPHDETTDIYDSISISLSFKRMTFSQSQTQQLSSTDVANSADSDRVNSGNKSTTTNDGSILTRMYDRVFGG